MPKPIQKGLLKLNIEKKFQGLSHSIAREIANSVYRKSQSIVPVDTGELEESCRVEYISEGHYRVVYDCDHAIYAHEQPQSSRHSGLSQFLAIAVDDVRDEIIGYELNAKKSGDIL